MATKGAAESEGAEKELVGGGEREERWAEAERGFLWDVAAGIRSLGELGAQPSVASPERGMVSGRQTFLDTVSQERGQWGSWERDVGLVADAWAKVEAVEREAKGRVEKNVLALVDGLVREEGKEGKARRTFGAWERKLDETKGREREKMVDQLERLKEIIVGGSQERSGAVEAAFLELLHHQLNYHAQAELPLRHAAATLSHNPPS